MARLRISQDLGPEYFIPVSSEEIDREALSWVHGGQWSGTYALQSRLYAYGETKASMEEISDAIRSLQIGIAADYKELNKAEEALANPEDWSERELDKFEEALDRLPEESERMEDVLMALEELERQYEEEAAEIRERLLEEEEKLKLEGRAQTQTDLQEKTNMRSRKIKTAVSLRDLDSFTLAYLEAALWSSMAWGSDPDGDEDVPMDELFSIEDIDEDCLRKMAADCEKFQKENWDNIQDAELKSSYNKDEQAGRKTIQTISKIHCIGITNNQNHRDRDIPETQISRFFQSRDV